MISNFCCRMSFSRPINQGPLLRIARILSKRFGKIYLPIFLRINKHDENQKLQLSRYTRTPSITSYGEFTDLPNIGSYQNRGVRALVVMIETSAPRATSSCASNQTYLSEPYSGAGR